MQTGDFILLPSSRNYDATYELVQVLRTEPRAGLPGELGTRFAHLRSYRDGQGLSWVCPKGRYVNTLTERDQPRARRLFSQGLCDFDSLGEFFHHLDSDQRELVG